MGQTNQQDYLDSTHLTSSISETQTCFFQTLLGLPLSAPQVFQGSLHYVALICSQHQLFIMFFH